MQRMLSIALLVLLATAAGAEPLQVSFVIHGRPRLHEQPAGTPGYGLMTAALYEGEPVILTATAFNAPAGDVQAWVSRVEWSVTTESGEPVSAKVVRETGSTAQGPYVHRLRSNTSSANFRIDSLAPGRYIVSLSWIDPASGEKQPARRDGFAVYRGDESPLIRAWYLRDKARTLLAKGTRESYEAARPMLLEAAKDNDDPSFYEELADVSLPWAQPEDTAAYYDRALAVARTNLEKKFGPEGEWPERAWQLYRPRFRKTQTFRSLVTEYAMKFADVKVVITRDGESNAFVMERRSDGKQLRVVALTE